MVNRVIGPTVCCGLGSLVSGTSPLQPNHRPPFCFSASSTPAARPPAVASPSWIGATRFETTTSRDIEWSASPADGYGTAGFVTPNLGRIAPVGQQSVSWCRGVLPGIVTADCRVASVPACALYQVMTTPWT